MKGDPERVVELSPDASERTSVTGSTHHAAMGGVSLLRGVLAIGLIGLIGASLPLWSGGIRSFVTTKEVEAELQVPFFRWLCGVPAWVDGVLLIALVVSLLLMLRGSSSARMTRVSTLMMVGTLGLLVLLDQLRLQPWVYLFLWLGVLLGLAPNRTGLQYARWLIASLYVWSGVSKVDPLFAVSHGQMLLEGTLKSLDVSMAFWPEMLKRGLVWGMPVGEILVGVLLLSRRWELWGLIGSVVMHGLLISALSGRGLDHGWTVLGWNLYLIVQNLVLFRGDAGPSARMTELTADRGSWDRIAGLVLVIPLLCPLSNPWGYWDHWPSWSLYSSRPGGVEVFVDEKDAGRLPTSVQEFVLPAEPFSEWRRIRIEEWCFREHGVPPVPEVRWKLALAIAMGTQSVAQKEGGVVMRVRVRERSGWWSTEWVVRESLGLAAMREECGQYWLNTTAREIPSDLVEEE